MPFPPIKRALGPSRRAVLAGAAGALAVSPRALRAQSAAEDRLRVVQPWAVRNMRPSDSGSAFTRVGLTESLVAVDPGGTIAPALAQSWTVSDDGLAWRFRLRAGAVFHDGSPVTSEAVKASYERLLPSSLYLRTTGIAAIEAAGEDVVFRLPRPFGPFLAYLVDHTAHVLAPQSFGASGEVATIIGTGPFRLTEADFPRSLTLARHDGYWGRKAAFARAQVDAVPNGETRANIAAAGDADIVLNIPTPSVSRVGGGSAVRIARVVIPRVHVMTVNCAKPQFSDVRTRQALSLAIDRAAIAAGIMRNPALAATQQIPPVLPDWHFPDMAPHRHDVAAANRLLDEAGWMKGGDGIRAKDGVRFAGTVRTFANRPELPIIAAAFQAQFRAIGFELAISVGEFQAITDGKRDGTLDLGLSSRNLVIAPDPIASLALDFTTDGAVNGDTGATNWRHDGIRSDVAAYLATSEAATLAPLRRRIIEVLQRELPVIPIVWYDQIVAVARRIGEVPIDPFEQRYLLERIRLA